MNSIKYLVGKAGQIIFTYLIWLAIGVFNLVFLCRQFVLRIILKLKSTIGNEFKTTAKEPTGKEITEW
jgi:hypothetical protein